MHRDRASRFVDWFVSSEYFANWQAEEIESGGYSRNADRRDRYSRCHDAAEDGVDGSTHAEVIDDFRSAFRSFIRDHKRNWRAMDPDRFTSAVEAHFDRLEQWHAKNGTLEQVIG